jgi:hypothetical protein
VNDTAGRLDCLREEKLLVVGFSFFQPVFAEKLPRLGENSYLKGGKWSFAPGSELTDQRGLPATLLARDEYIYRVPLRQFCDSFEILNHVFPEKKVFLRVRHLKVSRAFHSFPHFECGFRSLRFHHHFIEH